MKRTLGSNRIPWLVLAVLGFSVVGCKLAPPPDPNDPTDVDVMQIDVLRRNLDWASQAVNERVIKGEITIEKGRELLADSARKLLHSVKIERVNPMDAWEYGDLFRTAEDWKLALRAYDVAVRQAVRSKNEDRRINDSLHLAQAQARLGDIEKAFATARTTFKSDGKDKAPILMSVLYELVPAAEGKGNDAELAKLLEEAIGQHNQVIVNPDSRAGVSFLAAKAHHIRKAWEKVIALYHEAGMDDQAEEARLRSIEKMSSQQRV